MYAALSRWLQDRFSPRVRSELAEYLSRQKEGENGCDERERGGETGGLH